MTLKERFEYTVSQPFDNVNTSTDTEWNMEIIDNVLYLKFQESKSVMDWKQNFDFLKTPYKKMPKSFRVHRGFFYKYKSVSNVIMSKIKTFYKNYKVEKIEIFGYSQGGALAILAHEDIWFHYPKLRNKIFTTVFAAPRVVSFFAPFERWENVTRVVNSNDVVPRLPFFWLGYKHVGKKEVVFGNSRRFYTYKITDHLSKNYRKNIETLF